jgi:peptidoglycan/xylan/chitin deacetylase (PgdA/CDA1 family)
MVYLTFDDGPHPDITPWVLDVLRTHGAKATFFVVGSRVQRYPEVMERMRSEGHAIGNHTMTHPDGWLTPVTAYMDEFRRCAELTGATLFRPPYGRITPTQYRNIAPHARVVMWDVLSADFDSKCSPDRCVTNVLDNVRPGSIIVFHDSQKAWPRLEKALPAVLNGLKEKGLRPGTLI